MRREPKQLELFEEYEMEQPVEQHDMVYTERVVSLCLLSAIGIIVFAVILNLF